MLKNSRRNLILRSKTNARITSFPKSVLVKRSIFLMKEFARQFNMLSNDGSFVGFSDTRMLRRPGAASLTASSCWLRQHAPRFILFLRNTCRSFKASFQRSAFHTVSVSSKSWSVPVSTCGSDASPPRPRSVSSEGEKNA